MMHRVIVSALSVGLLLTSASPLYPASEEVVAPVLSRERVVLRTLAGDVVLALFPEVAPKHAAQFLRLARSGIFDSIHFYRVEPNFLVQVASAHERLNPLLPEQKAIIEDIPGEFNRVPHREGILSMAREAEDPDSAQTSFSILLGEAPHLDRAYTVFGKVVSGMDVVREMVRVPRNRDSSPRVRLTVHQALVYENEEALASLDRIGVRPIPVPSRFFDPPVSASDPRILHFLAGGIGAMVLLSLSGFLFRMKLGGSSLAGLLMLNVFIGAFLLFVILAPRAHQNPRMALGTFLGLLTLLKLLGRMESPS